MKQTAISRLIEAALAAREHAYAPYSKFPVGAAVMAEDGTIYTGCNVENASYPAGLCAERCAIGAAIAAGNQNFTAIAVAGSETSYTAPCGICRQVMIEFHVPIVICARSEEDYIVLSGDDLLPSAFDEESLKQ